MKKILTNRIMDSKWNSRLILNGILKLSLCVLLLFVFIENAKGQIGYLYQGYGGSEFEFKHRPDIADSAYHLRFRRNGICPIWCQGAGYLSDFPLVISFHDTCTYKYHGFKVNLIGGSTTTLKATSPHTGMSNQQRIFKVCDPGFTNAAINGNILVSGLFVDTFELLKEYWFDTIIYLPEKCGMWQARNMTIYPPSSVIGCLNGLDGGPASTNFTNLDTIDYYNYNIIHWS